MSRFTKFCLITIILLLTVIAVRPIVSPQPAIAAPQYQYVVVQVGPDLIDVQKELDRRVADGWELTAPVVSQQRSGILLIFRKPAN